MDSKTTATNLLVLIIICSFILQLAIPTYTEFFWFTYQDMFIQPYRIFTNLFLHANLLHLSLNIYALFVFGNLLEKKIGSTHLIGLFFLGGLIGILSLLIAAYFNLETFGTVIGSSDSISLILGICASLVPEANVRLFFIKMKVQTALILFLAYEALAILGIFVLQPNAVHSAHIGPIIFGYLYAKFLIR